MNTDSALFHLVPADSWAALDKNTNYLPATYEQDGFIHATADTSLLLNVANHFYAGSKGEWLCLETSVQRVEATGVKVLFEPAAPVGETAANIPGVAATAMFPHIFGSLSPEAIIAVHTVTRDPNGRFLSVNL